MLKRKGLYIIILSSILLVFIPLLSYASAEGVITAETVKLREKASLEAELVKLLSVNDKVEVLKQEGDWYQVIHKDKTGYVYKDYVEVKGQIDIGKEEEANKQEEPKQEITYETIITEDTQVRLVPLIYMTPTQQIKKDTKIQIEQTLNGWCFIQAEGINGWIREEKIEKIEHKQQAEQEPEKQEEKKEEQKQETPKTKVGYVNVDTVNVRKDPDTSSDVITNVSKNTKVTIESEESNWSKVTVKGKNGYIASKYLSSSPVEVTNRSSNVVRTDNNEEKKDEKKDINDTEASEIVAYAKQFLGYKYISGGTSPKGFDCSGFTYYVYKHFGYSLNRTASGQSQNGIKVERANLQIGDLVLFSQGSKAIGHVGIYIGGNQFIHASNPDDGVKITSLSDSYYVARYVTARRILK